MKTKRSTDFKEDAVWERNGALHAVEGSEVHRGILLLWTLCGKHDIPANQAWLRRPEDQVNCPECLEHIDKLEANDNG